MNAKDQKIKMFPVGSSPIPANQQAARDLRAKARAAQETTTDKVMRTVRKIVGSGFNTVNRAGKRYIDAEDIEVPRRKKAAQIDYDRARSNIGSPKGSSWAETNIPTRRSVPAPKISSNTNFSLPNTLPLGSSTYGGSMGIGMAGFWGVPVSHVPNTKITTKTTIKTTTKKKKGK